MSLRKFETENSKSKTNLNVQNFNKIKLFETLKFRIQILFQISFSIILAIGVDIRIAHYPPYCSKWNPIEHRLFSQVYKAMEGVVFSDYQTVQNLIEQTTTKTGLTVVVRQNLKHYDIGLKINKAEVYPKRISYPTDIPELNYRIYP